MLGGHRDCAAPVSRYERGIHFLKSISGGAQGNAEAKKDLASLAKELTPQQVAEAREKAQKCKSSSYAQCD
jgi:hypothetical protein